MISVVNIDYSVVACVHLTGHMNTPFTSSDNIYFPKGKLMCIHFTWLS